MVGATTSRRGLELISAHDKLAKAIYNVRVLFKHIEHKARYSYKGISPSEASWWPYLTIYDQNRFRMSIIPRIPDFTNVHFYSRATTVAYVPFFLKGLRPPKIHTISLGSDERPLN